VFSVAKRQPAFDPNGQYSSHLRLVPRELLDAHPALWRYPVNLALALRRSLGDDPADRDHVLSLLDAVVAARVERQPDRDVVRTRQSVSDFATRILINGLSAAAKAAGTVRDVLPLTADRVALLRCIARVQAATYRATTRRRRAWTMRPVDTIKQTLAFFNGAIAAGLFENTGVGRRDRIQEREVRREMDALETADPARYCARRDTASVQPKEHITEEDAHLLLDVAAAMTPRYRCVLLLLYTLALRAGAIELLTPGPRSRAAVRVRWTTFGTPLARPCA
jgi:hypothetical protein